MRRVAIYEIPGVGITRCGYIERKDQDTAVSKKLFSVKISTCDIKIFFSELCWGKVMVAYTKLQQWKKEESERLRGERDQIKFIDLRFERWQVVRCQIQESKKKIEDRITSVNKKNIGA